VKVRFFFKLTGICITISSLSFLHRASAVASALTTHLGPTNIRPNLL
jgi:hypothetical protein